MINNSDIKELIAYFEAKENRNEKERYFLERLISAKNTFVVSCVMREDLEERGYDASNVDDQTMERIAEKMGDSFNEDGIYWCSLEAQADWLGVPLKERSSEND